MKLNSEQIKTLLDAGMIPVGAPDGIIHAFADACEAHGLNPFRKEIYLTSRTDRKSGKNIYAMIVGIDGLQQKAARTGRFAGVDIEQYDLKSDGTYKTAADFTNDERPKTCTVTVYSVVSGMKCGFTATAVFNEYYPNPTNKAETMPFNMIAKCARAKALKMAFSDELSGLHIEEERAAFEDDTISASDEPAETPEELRKRIFGAENIKVLEDLYRSKKEMEKYIADFAARKQQLLAK